MANITVGAKGMTVDGTLVSFDELAEAMTEVVWWVAPIWLANMVNSGFSKEAHSRVDAGEAEGVTTEGYDLQWLLNVRAIVHKRLDQMEDGKIADILDTFVEDTRNPLMLMTRWSE